jgi:hypothetical protein
LTKKDSNYLENVDMRKCFYDMNLFKEKDVEALNSEMMHFKENS